MNTSTLNYSFIAVPTNLFFALDNNLRNALTVLLQLSSVFADADGYFFRTNDDLQADFKMGKNLTIAMLESLYQYGLLQVKSVGFTKKNGKRQVNFYRVNVDAFKNYEQYHIYTITKNEELHLETVDYKAKDFKVTYTATTLEDTNDEEIKPTEPSNNVSEEIPSNEVENAPTAQEMANPAIVEGVIVSNDEIDVDVENLNRILGGEDEKEVEKAESPIKPIKMDDEVIETACAIPTDLPKVEKRNFSTNKLDDSIKQKCADLVQRYVEMIIPNSNESIDKCNQGLKYIIDKYNQGYIDIETKDKLCRELINARFLKHKM